MIHPKILHGLIALSLNSTTPLNSTTQQDLYRDVNITELALMRAEGTASVPPYEEHSDYSHGPSLWKSIGLMDTSNKTHPTHYMWKPEFDRLSKIEVLVCCTVLVFAGILCSAGGIGGGGIYVTVLMVFGNLNTNDAVPVSKAIVFIGSIITLVLNLKKAKSTDDTLIDYNICRVVVPSTLLGTYLGVFLNNVLHETIILAMLCIMLLIMTCMVGRSAYLSYHEDVNAAELLNRGHGNSAGNSQNIDTDETYQKTRREKEIVNSDFPKQSARNVLYIQDVIIGLTMLVTVIACGVGNYKIPKSILLGHQLLSLSTVVIPVAFCTMTTFFYSARLVTYEGWSAVTSAKYSIMAVVTGSMAGLLGIGGGLIFAPFFLVMNVEPSIAVATSSTCVIFTASSTSLQYLFMDRVIVSLALLYGLANFIASLIGTKLVHFLQDSCSAQRSYISAIVGLGVFISAVLSVYELVHICVTNPKYPPPGRPIPWPWWEGSP